MPTIDHFSVWIEVEGKRLPEYKVQSSANGDLLIRTCWIPSEAGKEFKIVHEDTLRKTDTCTRLLVDGVRCTGRVTRMMWGIPLTTTTFEGEYTSPTTLKPYVFSNCQLTEDESIIGRAADSLGEIVVDIEEVVVNALEPWSTTVSIPPLNVHERAKKGVVHGTQLGNEVVAPFQQKVNVTTIRKIASFRFNYRPSDVLKADGIIPQDISKPVKRQADPQDIIDLTVEDGCQHCQCGASRRKKAKVSKRVDKTEVKKERPVMIGDGEVLDLTIWSAHHFMYLEYDRVLKNVYFFKIRDPF